MRFQTTIELGAKTATGFRVPAEIVEALESGKKPRVSVTIGGHTYRSTVAVYGGEFMLPLNAANRAAPGVAAGDDVEVDIELDTQPREVTVPPDLSSALDGDAVAKRAFKALSYSNRRRHVSSIEDAKTEETRRRRIAKTVSTLRDN